MTSYETISTNMVKQFLIFMYYETDVLKIRLHIPAPTPDSGSSTVKN